MDDFSEGIQVVSNPSGLAMQDYLKSTVSLQIVEYYKQLCKKRLDVYK